ncbi:MAG: linear amide C-N hydrolase [Prevotella sp.]|nr:linear amide C-N hydrolase [Bacteroides sp.]MCM1366580.1 linear amide C-N hydrolase [Prevotella sp.]MCM1437249.1 linear amide C-N hydrolase [Prevotella sp.]
MMTHKRLSNQDTQTTTICAPNTLEHTDKWLVSLAAMAFIAIICALTFRTDACTRVVYQGNDSLYIIGRSLDWRTPIPTNLYVYPRGMHKMGNNKPGSVEWTSKYGAVYAVSYDGGVTEGMNEVGLSVNGLFCKGTVYDNDDTRNRPPMSLAMFPAWLLDLCATTQECCDLLERHDFNIGGSTFDGGTVSALHWGITDSSGDSAIVEFDNGVIKIHRGKDLVAMTNDPQWEAMSAIIDYWDKKGGQHTLPGTVSSPDRCTRAHYFITHVDKTGDAHIGASITRSVVENASVPYLYSVQGEPNLSSTQWRSLSNLRDKLYYFDVVTNDGLFYIDLKKCDLREGKSVMKLDVSKSSEYVGEANKHLFKTAPFTPMY